MASFCYRGTTWIISCLSAIPFFTVVRGGSETNKIRHGFRTFFHLRTHNMYKFGVSKIRTVKEVDAVIMRMKLVYKEGWHFHWNGALLVDSFAVMKYLPKNDSFPGKLNRSNLHGSLQPNRRRNIVSFEFDFEWNISNDIAFFFFC